MRRISSEYGSHVESQHVGLKRICPKCHLAKHLGFAAEIGRSAEAKAHLASVNGWTAEQVDAYINRAFAAWRSRANIDYTLNVNYLKRYVPSSKIHMDWLDKPRTWVGTRLDAIVWASELLESDAIILDTETTGLLGKSNVEVIELAVIDMKGKVLYQRLFKPRYKIPVHAIEIHGITNDNVQACPTFAEQAQNITAALNGKTIVTFNAKFDREVIARTFKLHKVEGISARWECASHAYRTYSRSGPYLHLPCGSHRALADCKTVYQLIKKMANSAIL